MEEKITIIDVAKKAGVSKGTVDRVLHNRGEVSKKSAEKVRKAIEELNFRPNMYASLLASKKAKIIACVMPHFKKNEFWEKEYNGFMQGGAAVSGLNIRVQVFFYDQYDINDFQNATREALKSNPDGVIMPTLYQEATGRFAALLSEKKIPYIYVDTKVEEDRKHLAFIGMPRRDSGILCAALLTERQKKEEIKDVLILRIKRDSSGKSDPTQRRREGFLSYMAEKFPDTKIHNVYIDPSKPSTIPKTLSETIKELKSVRHIVMFNSRLHLIAKCLADNPCEGRRVIGFDDLSQNISMLRQGLADILIAQHVEEQSAKAIEIMSDYLLTNKQPDIQDNYFHIDILTKYNIEHY